MCGRYVLESTPRDLARAFDLEDVEAFPPRYNIAPTQPILVVRHRPVPPGANRPPREALHARWGLVPGWAKDPRDVPLLINARSETAATKASFRSAMRRGRVLVPVNGFYEWQKLPGGGKQPFYVRPRAGGLVAVAGLMEEGSEAGSTGEGSAGEGSAGEGDAPSAAIMTVDAAGPFREIHARMPVSVAPADWDRWLDPANAPADVADVPQTPDDDFWEAIPIGDAVNRVRNQGPELIERVEPLRAGPVRDGPPPEREDATPDEPAQGSLF